MVSDNKKAPIDFMEASLPENKKSRTALVQDIIVFYWAAASLLWLTDVSIADPSRLVKLLVGTG